MEHFTTSTRTVRTCIFKDRHWHSNPKNPLQTGGLAPAGALLESDPAGALCIVHDSGAALDKSTVGIILPQDIDNFYRK